jgi:hypothetical protein
VAAVRLGFAVDQDSREVPSSLLQPSSVGR